VRSFDWDERKAAINRRKHRVSFEEAQTAFADTLAAIAPDPGHSAEEKRELLAGHTAAGRLVLVSFVERGNVIRIISARELTRTEQRCYEEKTFP
jgi:uncharacterized protein